MFIHLQYGKEGLEVAIQSSNVTTLAPRFIPELPDEAAAFREAVRAPINSRPLRELIGAIPAIPRPRPPDRLLAWLSAELGAVPAENFVTVNGTGSHRVNPPAELASMVGDEIASRYRIVNHNSHDPATLAFVRKTGDGR